MGGRAYGRIALAGLGGFLLLLITLHVVEPGFSVVDDYTSDYALGDLGWLMRLAFVCAAAALLFLGLLAATWVLHGVFARDPGWRGFAPAQRWWAVAYTAAFVNSFFLPATAGIGQRLLVAVLMVWLLGLAWRLRSADAHGSGRHDGVAHSRGVDPSENRSADLSGQS